MSAFSIFFAKKSFEKLPVADSHVYEETVVYFLCFYANKKITFAYCLWND
jgi:hypothetical protein